LVLTVLRYKYNSRSLYFYTIAVIVDRAIRQFC